MNAEKVKFILSTIIVTAVVVITGALLFVDVPVENDKNFNIALVAVVGLAGTVIGYYFGSSSGSERKTELLAKPQVNEVEGEAK